MKILRNVLCIIFIIICENFNKFVTYSLKHSRNEIYKKFLFLNSNILNKHKNLENYKNVYNNKSDSLIKSSSLGSNYSDYVKTNQIVEIPTKNEKVKNILSIETSFDNTCLAVIRSDGEILSEINQAQPEIIKKYGGLKPYSSKEEHERSIDYLSDKVIKESGLKLEDIDEIAVTRGPGNELCLRVGYNYGLDLSKKYNIPLVSENHIAAHCLSPMITDNQIIYINREKKMSSNELKYPYLSLLISGAHAQIYLVEDPSTFHLMCDTIDQFPGSVLDRCARMLGLDIANGGGAELEKAAKKVNSSRFKFTVPVPFTNYLYFCFSGIESQLKTELQKIMKKNNVDSPKKLPREIIYELAHVSQNTVFDVIFSQLKAAIGISETFFPIHQLAIVGGVSANDKLKDIISDYLYQRDDSVLFMEQQALFRRANSSFRRFFTDKLFNLSIKNPFKNMFHEFKNKVKNLEDLIYYLCNPDLMPDLLMPGHLEKVSSEYKCELHRSMLDLYFHLIGFEGTMKIKSGINITTSRQDIIGPSDYILEMIRNDPRSPFPSILGNDNNRERWDLFSTSKKYSTDNAVMIGFSLIEKHKMGIKGIRNLDKIDGKDVLPRWNLGTRRNWEILSDICKLDSLLRYR